MRSGDRRIDDAARILDAALVQQGTLLQLQGHDLAIDQLSHRPAYFHTSRGWWWAVAEQKPNAPGADAAEVCDDQRTHVSIL
jgi:hypothetical protein